MIWFLGTKGKSGDTSERDDVSLEIVDPRDVDGHCMITGNLQIRGDVYFSGQLRIDGRVDGKVSVYEGGKGQLVVSKGAVINGPVFATSVLTDGTMNGPMDVRGKLECRANAIIRGRVVYGSIHITDGARIEAQCRQRDQVAPKPAADADAGTSGISLATRDISKKFGGGTSGQ